jgi:hypothetical protein
MLWKRAGGNPANCMHYGGGRYMVSHGTSEGLQRFLARPEALGRGWEWVGLGLKSGQCRTQVQCSTVGETVRGALAGQCVGSVSLLGSYAAGG